MRLPVTLVHHDDEAAIDFVARLAAANGFPSLSGFLEHTELTFTALLSGEDDAMSTVSAWSGVPSGRLKTMAVTNSGPGGTWQLGHAVLNKEMRSARAFRFCARCVVSDRRERNGRLGSRAYRRAWWTVRGIESCPDHACALTEIAGENVDVRDFPLFVSRNIREIESAAASNEPCRQRGLDKYLRDRVLLEAGTGFLDRFEAHVAAEFSRYLGDFIVEHDIADLKVEGMNSCEWGFSAAMGGEEEVRRRVVRVIDDKRPLAQHTRMVLGPMWKWLRRNRTRNAYSGLVDLMQDILERNMPVGEGQIIFRPVAKRHLYCLNSAYAEFGIFQTRIRALMKAADPGFRDGLPDGSTYVDAATIRPILEEAGNTFNSREAGDRLGLQEDRVLLLLDTGLLERVEERSGDGRPYNRITRASVIGFLAGLEEKLLPVDEAKGYYTLPEAARKFKYPMQVLIRMIIEGRVEAVVLPGSTALLDRVRFAPNTKQMLLPESYGSSLDVLANGNAELMRLRDAERTLRTTNTTIRHLVSSGFLATRNLKFENGRNVRFIERRSLSEFQTTYASLTEVADALCSNRHTVRRRLNAAGIKPSFDPPSLVVRFYRRSELLAAGIQI